MSSIVDHWYARRTRSNPKHVPFLEDRFPGLEKQVQAGAARQSATFWNYGTKKEQKQRRAAMAKHGIYPPSEFTKGATVIYDDGRPGHRKVRGEILATDEHGMTVQFKDRADTTRIRFADREWMDHIKRARSNPLYAVSLKTGASKRVDRDRKTLLMAIYRRLHQVGDGRIVAGKHVVMHAPSGHRTFVLEDMSDAELRELGGKLAGRRNPSNDRTSVRNHKLFDSWKKMKPARRRSAIRAHSKDSLISILSWNDRNGDFEDMDHGEAAELLEEIVERELPPVRRTNPRKKLTAAEAKIADAYIEGTLAAQSEIHEDHWTPELARAYLGAISDAPRHDALAEAWERGFNDEVRALAKRK